MVMSSCATRCPTSLRLCTGFSQLGFSHLGYGAKLASAAILKILEGHAAKKRCSTTFLISTVFQPIAESTAHHDESEVGGT